MTPQQTTPSAASPAGARIVAPLAALLMLTACGSAGGLRTPTDEEYNPSSRREEALRRSGSGSEGILIFGTDRSRRDDAGSGAPGLGVNAFLWRATLDTLSFMPLVSADPFGGVIITDWYAPPQAGGERFKATAYVLGRQLRSDGVRVQVFRQVQQNGQWLDVPTAGSTNSEMEDRVLARARELRVQSAGR
jgi:predicted small lipoprotein YifL